MISYTKIIDLVNNTTVAIDIGISGVFDSTIPVALVDTTATITFDPPSSTSVVIGLEDPTTTATVSISTTGILNPSPSPSPIPPFIKVCGFGFEPEIDDAFLRNGTYPYSGTDDNGNAFWQNPNSYELKFDITNNSYVLGIIGNPYDYYLSGTTSAIGSTWRNTLNQSVDGASTIIDPNPFSPCS